MAPEPAAPNDRLAQLEELIAALRPVVLAEHSEHGLQGLSGLVGQYRAALKEIEELRALRQESKGTPLDELFSRRAARGADAPRKTRSAR
jgi:hypothetical protein